MAIEIVDFPIKNCDFPVRYVNVYQVGYSPFVQAIGGMPGDCGSPPLPRGYGASPTTAPGGAENGEVHGDFMGFNRDSTGILDGFCWDLMGFLNGIQWGLIGLNGVFEWDSLAVMGMKWDILFGYLP